MVMFQNKFFDMSQVKFGTIILYIVFLFASLWIFGRLRDMVDYLLLKLDKDYK